MTNKKLVESKLDNRIFRSKWREDTF
jgi:hypothetical protein